MLKSSLCNYSDACILVKGTITLVLQGADAAAIQAYKNNKQLIFKNSGPFTSCIIEINNTQVDNTRSWCRTVDE